jgi:hypothetical protein
VLAPETPFTGGADLTTLARRRRLLPGCVVPLAHRLTRYQTMHCELEPSP